MVKASGSVTEPLGILLTGFIVMWLVFYFIVRFEQFTVEILGGIMAVIFGGVILHFIQLSEKKNIWNYPIGLFLGFMAFQFVIASGMFHPLVVPGIGGTPLPAVTPAAQPSAPGTPVPSGTSEAQPSAAGTPIPRQTTGGWTIVMTPTPTLPPRTIPLAFVRSGISTQPRPAGTVPATTAPAPALTTIPAAASPTPVPPAAISTTAPEPAPTTVPATVPPTPVPPAAGPATASLAGAGFFIVMLVVGIGITAWLYHRKETKEEPPGNTS